MAVTISGDTGINTPALVLPGSSSGSTTIQAPATAGSGVVTTSTATGTMGFSGPAFAAHIATNQSVTSGTITLAALATELFDTASCFNNTNATVGSIPAYAFLPNVAGYYQVTFAVLASASSGTITYAGAYIYKNGTAISRNSVPPWNATNADSVTSQLVYLDGSTDYLQFYGQATGTSPIMLPGQSRTLASVSFIRPA